VKVYKVHWTVHPDKDRVWYEKQCDRMTEDEIARELDLNFAMSVSGKVFSNFKRYKHVTHRFEPIRGLPVIRVWDFGHTNAVLYMQFDQLKRKRVWHERILGRVDDGEPASDTVEMAQQAMVDSEEYFAGFEFLDVCDPQGKVAEATGVSASHIHVLNQEFGIYPAYQSIDKMAKRGRPQKCIQMVQKDLQYAPGGKEAFQIFVPANGEKYGCPILLKAMESAYSYKKDAAGNFTDQINQKHPFEDVVDCLFYGYIEEGATMQAEDSGIFEPDIDSSIYNAYLGY
jgi:hypothetical protein